VSAVLSSASDARKRILSLSLKAMERK
jgi:hypothetical protein